MASDLSSGARLLLGKRELDPVAALLSQPLAPTYPPLLPLARTAPSDPATLAARLFAVGSLGRVARPTGFLPTASPGASGS